MALIDFECPKCGHKFFDILKPEDAEGIRCPKCGSPVKRVYKGKFYGKGPGDSGCGGNCSACGGCH